MADLDDVRKLVESLPRATFEPGGEGQAHASVAGKGFAWTWLERVDAEELRVLLTDAWRCRAPKRLVKESGR